MATNRFDPRLPFKSDEHQRYSKRIDEIRRHFEMVLTDIWRTSIQDWEMFLAIQKDTRDPVDEQWRSDVFVPLPFITTRTKAAQGVELLGNVEPIWQVEATKEEGQWYDDSKQIERLLDYTHRMNGWRKFLYKQLTSRSVQGTSFMKIVYGKRSHPVYLTHTPEDEIEFQMALQEAERMGLPTPPDWQAEPDIFEKWRTLVNKSGKAKIPAAPKDGVKEIVEYEGPIFQYVPMWTMRLDPLIDELKDQKYVMHRMVKPLQWVLDRADLDYTSDKPYYLPNVKEAMNNWDGQILEQEERDLAERMGLNPVREAHPYYENAVELIEVWSPDEDFKFAIFLNRSAVINKLPFSQPLLTSAPNILAVRNIIVPGHFFGMSDYREPKRLFTELNTFRRTRMDGAMLTTMPAFVKQQGINLTEPLKKIFPGAIITLPTANAIQSLIKHVLPAEAYREPQEIKAEVEDATEVYSSVKGAPAPVGRVTGTEFSGRQGQVLLKYKVDASLIEEEFLTLPSVILSLYAQMGPGRILKTVGGDPSALINISRDQLVEALNMRFRFRGATKNIQPDLQVQQLTTALREFGDVLTPAEKRQALQLVFELLDIRGYSKILTETGGQEVAMQAQVAGQAGVQGNAAAAGAGAAANIPIPGSLPPEAAAAVFGGGGGAPEEGAGNGA